jgi:hypothetical protein
MIDSIKVHVGKHKIAYSVGTIVVIAGITCVIMRGVASQYISRGISVTADRGISVIGKNVVMKNVSYISSNRMGAPSWVVRCRETGEIFRAQRAAAIGMGLPESEISKHLNGVMDNVRGFTFERICLAA